MPGSADFIQRAIHTLEAGGLAVWIRRGLAVVAVIALALIYIVNFRGLATSQAMDQAQIGREIARGHGWRTNVVRPRAVGQLQAHGKNVARAIWSDTYNAPLPPLVDAIALRAVRSHWAMTPNDLIYVGDRAIAAMSILIFLASVGLLFLVARRLFDQRLALLACALVLLCDACWQYSLSGLPQMLLLFFFNATVYALVRAVEARNGGGRAGLWLAAAGAGFGLLALTHALTIWMFLGALIYCVFFFRPRGWAAIIVLLMFLLVYTPWLLRNYIVTGNPAGVAIYSLCHGLGQSEAGWMRQVTFDWGNVGIRPFYSKVAGNLVAQTGHIFEYLGGSVVALAFFFALLHVFKRPETVAVRWMIVAMWVGAVLGMAFSGITEEEGVAANQLHLIFMPLMTCYGLAYLLVQWNRLDIGMQVARVGFITLLFVLCSLPMVHSLVSTRLGVNRTKIHWPPYIPPLISVMNIWMKPEELIASDMPCAVAWYADRRCVWLPDTTRTFSEISDYRLLGAPITGLYLTPISGSSNTLRDIWRGEYHEWGALIQHTTILQNFPLKWANYLGLDNECIFFSDHDRQKEAAEAAAKSSGP
jgi:4-amino-4-deoxy-L-arabinose transferase-like glycosyltransferase